MVLNRVGQRQAQSGVQLGGGHARLGLFVLFGERLAAILRHGRDDLACRLHDELGRVVAGQVEGQVRRQVDLREERAEWHV